MLDDHSKLLPNCPVCSGSLEYHFTAQVLFKYEVVYYNCPGCGLMNTEKPYWLAEAYNSAIVDLDVGLVQRNIDLSKIVGEVLDTYFDPYGRFLDFAGGYGLFVRLMRDKGFNFFRHDKYCENIFAKYFEVSSLLKNKMHFELVTAFELLEHLVDPFCELEKLFKVTDSVLFSTELLPSNIFTVNDWWYFVPESGQHITFYKEKTLQQLAYKLNVNFYSDGKFLHIFTKRTFEEFSFLIAAKPRFLGKLHKLIINKLASSRKQEFEIKNISIENDYRYIKEQIETK